MSALTRRSFLRGLAALPLLPRLPGLPRRETERSLILVWLDGGMSHLDTFDGKPDATPEIRGELKSARCALEGVFVSEHLSEVGKRLDRCVLVRSLTHGEGNHDRASHYLLTGHRPSPVLVHPCLGALPEPDASRALPSFVAIPSAPDYGRSGFLPITRGPFEVHGDPGRGDFVVPNLAPPAGLEGAIALRDALDQLDGEPRSEAEAARDRFRRQARALAADPEARSSFDLRAEPTELRARYGPHRLGQSCLLARRLVQRGVRVAMVHMPGWDDHQNIKSAMTYGFPGKIFMLDQALGALLDDLREKELEERVVIALLSEFGRTPRMNPLGGRDHWPRAQCALLAGAGLRKGVVIGKTDERGEEPSEDPVSPGDVFATLGAALRLDLEATLRTADGRPVRLVEEGAAPIAKALGWRTAGARGARRDVRGG
jgi:hypothetical protein